LPVGPRRGSGRGHDNQHPYALQLSRTVEIAKGLGMAFANRTTVPVSWNADGRNYWHYQRTAID
jgi:hypothetical protein